MRPLIVAANWKMHGNISQIRQLISALVAGTKTDIKAKLIVCPPSPYLYLLAQKIKNSVIALGAQNVSEYESGAFTGEVSVAMLKDFAVGYVIVGHSERRALYAEGNKMIVQKIKAVQEAEMTPILCVGETLKEREDRQMKSVITTQINAVINTLSIKAFANLIIAYEPVWAIGTGVTATAEQAQEAHAFIRALLAKYDEKIAKKIAILYGGSLNSKNAAKLFSCADIDGGLVGGASLDAESFLKIARS